MTFDQNTDIPTPGFDMPAFTWEELAADGRDMPNPAGRVAFIRPGGTTDNDAGAFVHETAPWLLGECAAFREWLLHHGFNVLAIPTWPGAGFADVREVVLAVLSVLPDATVHFEGAEGAAFERAAQLWIGQVTCGAATMPQPRMARRPKAHSDRAHRRIDLELGEVLRTAHLPEHSLRVELKLQHLRDNAAAPVLQERVSVAALPAREDAARLFEGGSRAANAIIPGSGIGGDTAPALHLGRGLLLRPDAQSPGGYTLEHSGNAAEFGFEREELSVVMDPRPGKILKHESAHALYVAGDARVRAAVSGFKVLGHGARHIFLEPEGRDASIIDAVVNAGFLFSESWALLGVTAERVGREGRVLAVLRTGAIWDDLNKRADLGDFEAADMLHLLKMLRSARRPMPAVPRLVTRSRLVSPVTEAGKQ